MAKTSRECLSVWKSDIYHQRYSKVVQEVSLLASVFYDENDADWIEAFEELSNEINGLSKDRISYNVKVYLKDFLKKAIKTVKGENGKTKLRNQTRSTLEKLKNPYSS